MRDWSNGSARALRRVHGAARSLSERRQRDRELRCSRDVCGKGGNASRKADCQMMTQPDATKMMRPTTSTIRGAALLLALVAGCGSSDNGSDNASGGAPENG